MGNMICLLGLLVLTNAKAPTYTVIYKMIATTSATLTGAEMKVFKDETLQAFVVVTGAPKGNSSITVTHIPTGNYYKVEIKISGLTSAKAAEVKRFLNAVP